MSDAMFHGKPVLVIGPGQCPDCKQRVLRVLVDNGGGHRSWHAAEIARYGGYEAHRCGPPPDLGSPLKRAA